LRSRWEKIKTDDDTEYSHYFIKLFSLPCILSGKT
jgi:hypothetical protein